jgi:dynein heavy chain 2
VDYHDDFRLYLSTRNPYPVIAPDASALVGVTNFSITHSGLESQLLGLTIQHEKPELEQQKSVLLKQEEDLKVQLADLEKSLLQTLATSEGNILENVKLIEALSETKAKSTTIQEGLAESARLQVGSPSLQHHRVRLSSENEGEAPGV